MSRLLSSPLISFKCNSCGAYSEDDAENFKKVGNSIPPQWSNKCAFCNSKVICSPSALIAKDVNETDYSAYMNKRFGL